MEGFPIMTSRLAFASKLVASLFLLTPAMWAQSIVGLWDATVEVNGKQIPFHIEFAGDGASVKGWFFNGSDREVSTSGKYENGSLVLNFDSYASVLKLTRSGAAMDGTYVQRGRTMKIHAVPNAPHVASTGKVPDIGGLWVMEEVKSSKGEKAWNLVIKQKGDEISGAILRVDGDTGTLEGSYKDGAFLLSHFSGARPSQVLITPKADGTLSVDLSGEHHEGSAITAIRPEVARAKSLPLPDDASKHTGVKDPTQPFTFNFPDLAGKMVSNTDPRFKGKVVLIDIMGSWCPNCHDEAPFLTEVYNKYHSQGLEVVALAFEEAEQLQDLARLKAYVKTYGAKYTVLVGGETSTAKDKLTQAVNWDAWPTTFFVGRDGLVKAVHAGFPGPGSGELYKRDKDEVMSTIEKLLASNETSKK
jgi:thiol-disulfide isomerase/thioredoxin